MGIYIDETKNTRLLNGSGFRKVVCKCGSKRIKAYVVGTEKEADNGISEDAGLWLELRCGKCGSILYYNGA